MNCIDYAIGQRINYRERTVQQELLYVTCSSFHVQYLSFVVLVISLHSSFFNSIGIAVSLNVIPTSRVHSFTAGTVMQVYKLTVAQLFSSVT
jgi:hypothetical protein